jgi:hypothetical protein
MYVRTELLARSPEPETLAEIPTVSELRLKCDQS